MACTTCGGPRCAGCGPDFHKVTGGIGAPEDAEKRPLGAGTVALGETLAFQLVDTADVVRDLYTTFGLRPYAVNLVRTRWAGGRRGLGAEEIVTSIPILPTPLVSDLTALTEINTPIGLDETGEILLQEVSGRFTEDQLRGQEVPGETIPVDQNFFYEIEFPPACAGREGERRRFTIKGAPMYYADRFQWQVRLEKQRQDRARNGDLR